MAFARLTWDGETVALRDRAGAALRPRAGRRRRPAPSCRRRAEGEAALLAAVTRGPRARRSASSTCSPAPAPSRLPLAETGPRFTRSKATPRMLAALDQGWRQTPGLHRVTTETRDLFRRPLEPDELNGFDAVVIDPPRAGAEAQTAALAASRACRSSPPSPAIPSPSPATRRPLIEAGYGSTGCRSSTSSAGPPMSNLSPASAAAPLDISRKRAGDSGYCGQRQTCCIPSKNKRAGKRMRAVARFRHPGADLGLAGLRQLEVQDATTDPK